MLSVGLVYPLVQDLKQLWELPALEVPPVFVLVELSTQGGGHLQLLRPEEDSR